MNVESLERRYLLATFTVNSTADGSDLAPGDGLCDAGSASGVIECTLRAAIEEANATAAPDTIFFDFGTPGQVQTISPLNPLPDIAQPLTIDGTQSGSFVPLVQLDGSNAGLDSSGLRVVASASTVRGLIINRFDFAGIVLRTGSRNVVEANFIGTDVTGTVPMGNGGDGVLIESSSNNTIGGSTSAAGNIIAFNDGHGVLIPAGDRAPLANTITNNSIFENAELGIDLDDDGVTSNDAGDGDGGANDLQNFPEIVSVSLDAGSVRLRGFIEGPASTQVRAEFFSSSRCDETGFGEGEHVLGSLLVPIDFTGVGNFDVEFPLVFSRDQFFTATATDSAGNTSEFSGCVGTLEVTELGNQAPDLLVAMLLDPAGSIRNVQNVRFTGDGKAAGTFRGGFGPIGIEQGIVLSSGSIQNVLGPNMEDLVSAENGAPGDPELTALAKSETFDATSLEFDFIADQNVLSFQYVFASDEYNEFVGAQFNDVFAFFLNGLNVATLPGTLTTVSINNVNRGNPFGTNAKNPEFFVNNDLDDDGGTLNTEMDGMTVVLSVRTPINPGVPNRIKLAIADVQDMRGDSSVFLRAGSFASKDPEADLGVTQVDAPDPTLPSGEVTYNVVVQNAGPAAATAVTLSDTLPPNTIFVSATPSQGQCSENAGTVSCDLTVINSGADATVEIVVLVGDVADGTVLENRATVKNANEVDPNSQNDSSSELTTVQHSADLAVTKVDDPDPVTRGEELTYTIAIENLGPSTASNVRITDSLPAGVTFVSASPAVIPCTAVRQTVTCDVGNLKSDSAIEVTITVQVDGASGLITNNVTVSSDTADPNRQNNSATADTTVIVEADIRVTKSDSPDPAIAGGEVTYTLTVENRGPSDASNVQLTDTLPSGLEFVSATPGAPTCQLDDGIVACELGSVPAKAQVEVIIVGRIPPSADDGVELCNFATVSATETDPSIENNETTQCTTVNREADLAVSIIDSPDPVVAGTQLTYTIGVTNRGLSNASDVVLTDALPAGVSFVSAVPAAAGCTESQLLVTCTLGDIAAGDALNITLSVLVDSAVSGTLRNVARVASSTTDPDLLNNESTEDTTVSSSADLRVLKTDSPDPVTAGRRLTYTVTVENLGPSDDRGATLTDALPAGASLASTSQPCTESAGVVVCDLGSIAAAARTTVEIIVDVSSSVTDGASLCNRATVTSQTDPDPTNDEVIECTTVRRESDLGLMKLDDPDPVVAGTRLDYTVRVTNPGPSDASDVVLTDLLPQAVQFVAATPGSPACSHLSGVVTCRLGDLPAGATAEVVLTVDVSPSASGLIANTASVTSASRELAVGNNSVTESTRVTRRSDLEITKTDSADQAGVGELLTYTIAVTNNGPSDASGVRVTDTLPATAPFVSASRDCTHVLGTVTCDLGDLAAGATESVLLTVRPGAAGVIVNSAVVASNEFDPVAANDGAIETTTVIDSLDIDLQLFTTAGTGLLDQLLVRYEVIGTAAPFELTFSSSADARANGNDTPRGPTVRVTDPALLSGGVHELVVDGGPYAPFLLDVDTLFFVVRALQLAGARAEVDLTNNDINFVGVFHEPAGISPLIVRGRDGGDRYAGSPDDVITFTDGPTLTIAASFLSSAVSAPTASVSELRVLGLGGDDLIAAAPMVALPFDVRAGAGNDSVLGGSAADRLDGELGDDLLAGAAGNDTLIGGPPGAADLDTADFSLARRGVTVNLKRGSARGDGRDFLIAIDNVIGSAFRDSITGNDGPNALFGGGGGDLLRAGAGDDVVDGGDGDDLLYGDDGNDRVLGGTGDDLCCGGTGDDNLQGEAGHDRMFGGDGDDDMTGGDGHDLVCGGDGDDVLAGDLGDDSMVGGRGIDELRGGLGFDQLLSDLIDRVFDLGGFGADGGKLKR